MLGCVVVLAAVGVVDGVALVFLHRVNPVAPTLDGLGLHGGGGRGLGTFAGGVVFVKIHARRWRVNDQRTPSPCGVEKLIHARRHFADAADGVFAVMQIPHVADDHRRRLGVPKNFLLSHGPVAVGVPDAVACVEGERFSVGQCERKQDGKNGGAFHEIVCVSWAELLSAWPRVVNQNTPCGKQGFAKVARRFSLSKRSVL